MTMGCNVKQTRAEPVTSVETGAQLTIEAEEENMTAAKEDGIVISQCRQCGDGREFRAVCSDS